MSAPRTAQRARRELAACHHIPEAPGSSMAYLSTGHCIAHAKDDSGMRYSNCRKQATSAQPASRANAILKRFFVTKVRRSCVSLCEEGCVLVLQTLGEGVEIEGEGMAFGGARLEALLGEGFAS
eukprot:2222601-Rhodomonas_salina.2